MRQPAILGLRRLLPGPARAQEPERPASRALRVDEVKIDALVNLAGELIVAKNGFAHLAKRVEDEIGDTTSPGP